LPQIKSHAYFLFKAIYLPTNRTIGFIKASSFKVGVNFTIIDAVPTIDVIAIAIESQLFTIQLIISIIYFPPVGLNEMNVLFSLKHHHVFI